MKKIVAAITCLLVLLSGCGKRPEVIEKQADYTIVVIGVDNLITDIECIMLWQIYPDGIQSLAFPEDIVYKGTTLSDLYISKGPEAVCEAVEDITGKEASDYIAFDSLALLKTCKQKGDVTFLMPYSVEYTTHDGAKKVVLEGERNLSPEDVEGIFLVEDFPGGTAAKAKLCGDFAKTILRGNHGDAVDILMVKSVMQTCGTSLKIDEIVTLGNKILDIGGENFDNKVITRTN